MQKKILVIGYGSIGKRHARNLIGLGIKPYIVTAHPDRLNAEFLTDARVLKNGNIKYCIIASPTARHLADLRKCVVALRGLKKILIEKPLECSYLKGKQISSVANKYNLEISIAYNLRFIDIFGKINNFIQKRKKKIKIVEIVAGQDLREWRPYANITQSYSSYRELGGGVDLDLSHEIDYTLWLFGNNFKDKLIYRAKLSNLTIDSPDIFKLVLKYKNFIVDITLDYIRRPRERHLKIICNDGENLYYDFVKGRLKINKKVISDCDDMSQSYKKMLKLFLGIDRNYRTKLCSLEEGLNVLKVLEV